MEAPLDILIFGATGFTGIHCIPFVAKLSKENGRNLTWGVAGRSEEKLKNALKETAEKLGIILKFFTYIPILGYSNFIKIVFLIND